MEKLHERASKLAAGYTDSSRGLAKKQDSGVLTYSKSSSNSSSPTFVLRGHECEVNVVRFLKIKAPTPFSKSLASGDTNGNVVLWNLDSRRSMSEFSIHEEMPLSPAGVLNITLLQENLLTQGRDGFLKIWDIASASPRCINSLSTDSFSFCKACSIAIEGNDYFALPGPDPGTVNIWDIRSSKASRSISLSSLKNVPPGMCTAIDSAQSKSSSILICASENGSLSCWDVRNTSKELCSILMHRKPLLSFALMKEPWDGKLIRGISGSPGKSLRPFIIDITNNCITKHRKVMLPFPGSSELRSFKNLIAGAFWDHSIRLFDWKSLSEVSSFHYHSDSVLSVDLEGSDSGIALASASKDHRIAVYNITA